MDAGSTVELVNSVARRHLEFAIVKLCAWNDVKTTEKS